MFRLRRRDEHREMSCWPRIADELDVWLGATLPDNDRVALACYRPHLPSRAECTEPLWRALVVRADERQREWDGPVGERVRDLDRRGLIKLGGKGGEGGLLLDPDSSHPLDRAHAELLSPEERDL